MAETFQQGRLDWLPTGSAARKLDWTRRQTPMRMHSVSFRKPTDFTECFNCYDEALWYCDACKIMFCRHDNCKEIHEYEHLLSRLGSGGPE